MFRKSNYQENSPGRDSKEHSLKNHSLQKHSRWLTSVSVSVAVAGLLFAGCSDSDSVSSNNGGSQINLGAMNYFPVDVGYSADFRVTDANGAEIRRESYSADSVVYVNGNVGVNWVQRDLTDSSVLSRGSMSWNNDRSVLYHTDDSSVNVERLLRSPLSDGSQWPRWNEPVAPGGSGSDLDLGNGGGSGDSSVFASDTSANNSNPGDNNYNPYTALDNPNLQLTSFPTKGAQTFYVASTTDKLTINGTDYENCLQIVNANLDETVNRYWYSPGVGLVKYALSAQPGEMTGTENGEIMN